MPAGGSPAELPPVRGQRSGNLEGLLADLRLDTQRAAEGVGDRIELFDG
jgi:hypothetical protein